MNMQKANLRSQLSIFYTGSFAHARTTRLNELTRKPSNDSPERIYMGTRMTKMKQQGRARKTSCTNMQKANLGSQLSIFDMGSFARACPCLNNLPERVHTEALKWPAQTNLHGHPHDRNEATRESQANKLHKRA